MKTGQCSRIKRELPPIWTKLTGRFKGTIYNAKIVEDKSSPIGRSIAFSKSKYLTMTATAMAITNNCVNGWKFWRIAN